MIGEGLDWNFSRGSAYDLADVMVVMDEAFDPAFGEAWTAPQCTGILSLPGALLLVARTGEVPIGFSLTRMVGDEAELLLLGVRPGFARNGVGRGLLLSTMDMAADHGVKYMHLEVRSDNQAIRFYESAGFEKVGVRPGYYHGNDNVIRDAFTYTRLLDA